MQVRSLRGQDPDPLVKVVVAGRLLDPVVDDQLGDPGGVGEPAQHEHRLLTARELPRPLPGTAADTLRFQQAGDELDRVVLERQYSRVCHTHGARDSLKLIFGRNRLLPGSRVSSPTAPSGPPYRP